MRRCRSNSLIMFKRNGFVLGVGVLLHGAMASGKLACNETFRVKITDPSFPMSLHRNSRIDVYN